MELTQPPYKRLEVPYTVTAKRAGDEIPISPAGGEP